jgi:hypothetical protein
MLKNFIEWIENTIKDGNLSNAIMAFVAIAVFVQSILTLLFKALSAFIKRVRNKVIILPNEEAFFYFSSEGMVMKLFFTLVSQNIDTIVTDVKIVLKNKKVVYKLKWDTFHSTYYESFDGGGGNSQLGLNFSMNRESYSYPHPVYLKQKVTQLFNVRFIDVEKSKELKIVAGEYDVIFVIFSTERKRPFKAKRNLVLNEPDIATLKKPKSSGKIAGTADNQPKSVRVNIETPPSKIYVSWKWIESKFKKGSKNNNAKT